VVNWDLVPLNALLRLDVIPGSNPLYGLNAPGGAIALHTRDGFSNPAGEVEVTGGDAVTMPAIPTRGGSL
jgi:iron complex outermembrane receptor protein